MMEQTRLGSFYEACVNVVIGFSINFLANLWLIPIFLHVSVPLLANWWMGLAYTAISLIRSYAIRRWFACRIKALSERLAGVV